MRAKLCGGPADGQIVQMETFFQYYVFKPQMPIVALSDGPFQPVSCVTGSYLPTTETDGPLHLYRWAGWNGPEHRDPGPAHTARERLDRWLDDTSWVDAMRWTPDLENSP